jgi:hypothetical protein
MLMTPKEAKEFIALNPKFTVHEVIHREMNKLFFDIDDAKIDLGDFERKVKRQLAFN